MRLSLAFSLVTFTWGFAFFSFILLTPLYADELGLSLTAAGVAIAASSIAVILFSPIWGVLADRSGRKKPFLILGTLLFALTSLSLFTAQTFALLVVLRFLQGAAFATNPLLTALFSDHFGRQAARRFGAFSAANALGWGLGSLSSGILADLIGIRWTFLVISVFPLVSAAILYKGIPEESPAEASHAAAAGPERRVPRKLVYLYATIFARHSAAVALWAMFPIYLRGFVGSLSWVGAINGINMIVQPLFMLAIGRAAEHRDKLQIISWGITGSIATFAVYATAPTIWQVLVGQLMIAAAWSAIFIGLNLYIMAEVPPGSRCRAFGYLQSSMTGAAAVGPLLGGALSDAFGIREMIWITAGLMATSFPFLWKLRSIDRAGSRLQTEAETIEPVGSAHDG